MKNDINNFLGEIKSADWFWYIKRLSGNDTQLTGGHQAGPYIPKSIIFDLFPELKKISDINPRIKFKVKVESHSAPENDVTAIWYNSKFKGTGTRNECRVTGWGGNDSPLLDPESTGSICVFAFHKINSLKNADFCKIWLCKNNHEERIIEEISGEIEPGKYFLRNIISPEETDVCSLNESTIPPEWLKVLPSGEEIIKKTFLLKPDLIQLKSDIRILKRRDCEYSIFLSLENIMIMPLIRKGFNNVEDFIELANSVANRRKSRAGKSLELHASRVFTEEGLIKFSHNEITEGQKRPDFIFPSIADYRNKKFAEKKLRMLAVKTTCKDRWRQILNEANRIKLKHLLTIQEGVSENQYKEMKEEGVILVVPKPLHKSYPEAIRKDLLTLDQFIAETKRL